MDLDQRRECFAWLHRLESPCYDRSSLRDYGRGPVNLAAKDGAAREPLGDTALKARAPRRRRYATTGVVFCVLPWKTTQRPAF